MEQNKMGSFIALQRKQLSMTQQDLADKLNLTNKAVSKWETGEGYPDISVLPALAEVLHVTVDELLKGEKGDPGQPAAGSYRIKETTQQAEFLLENSMKQFSNRYLLCLGIVLLGIISSSLSLRLFNGIYLTSIVYALIVSLSFLLIGAMFYHNICGDLKRTTDKYNSMVEGAKSNYNQFIYKKHILFHALYSILATICICVVPLYPFSCRNIYGAFHTLFSYSNTGWLHIEFYCCLLICFIVYCIFLVVGVFAVKKRFGNRKSQ